VRLVGNYILGETLGKGGYSWVKKGTDKKTKKVVALKFMTRADSSWEQEQAMQVKTEIKSMIRIASPHVMKLYAYNLNAKYPEKDGKVISTILLVLEYCPGGELFDILYYSGQLAEKTARTYFRQFITGLEACHNAGIIHRDIKPQNLLMDQNYQLKITDFGLSFLLENIHDQEQLMDTFYVGTRGYQPPELLTKRKYTKACDIFSAGVVLFILLTGYPPFDQGHKGDKWFRPLYKGDPAKFWAQHKGCGVSKSCQSLIESMLCYKPDKRITIEQIKQHPWFNGEVYDKDQLKKEVKRLHKIAREKRKNDKKKMSEMAMSVKKRDVPEETYNDLKEAWKEPPMGDTENLSSWSLPAKDTDPLVVFLQLRNIFEGKKIWNGQGTLSELDPEAPYIMEIATKMASNTVSPNTATNEFRAQVSVNRKGDDYIFNISRSSGMDALKWNKLYGDIEDAILANKIFDTASSDEVQDEQPELISDAPAEDAAAAAPAVEKEEVKVEE